MIEPIIFVWDMENFVFGDVLNGYPMKGTARTCYLLQGGAMNLVLKEINEDPGSPFCQGSREEILGAVRPYLREERLSCGQDLELGAHRGNCLYYVEEGRVEVSYDSGGTRIVVALIGEGEFFGEIGFFDGISRVRKIKASADTGVAVMDSPSARRLRLENPRLYADFLAMISLSICKKFRKVVSDSHSLAGYSASLSSGRRPLFRKSMPMPAGILETEVWKKVNEKVELFKAQMYEIASAVQAESSLDMDEGLYLRLKETVDIFDSYLEDLAVYLESRPELSAHIWGYIFKEIFPYFMRSRFAERAYFKPKGYAGDFLMMEAIYRNIPDGDGLFGLMVDRYCLDCPPPRAVRGRRRLLSRLIEKHVRNLMPVRDSIGIMNLACGSNRELFDFIARFPHSHMLDCLCIDADPEALEYTSKYVDVFEHDAGITLMQENVIKWSLGRVRHNFEPRDIIYSAGLTDYLDERLFTALVKRAWDYLKPGGVLILSNFSKANPNKAWMDHIFQWKLIHRDEQDLKSIFGRTPFGSNVEVLSEQEGVNLFAVATKAS